MTAYDVIIVGGGQAGLAASFQLKKTGLRCLLLNASEAPAGTWPHHYDSLTLFSPASYCSLPGMPFPGDPKRYPKRDEVVKYLKEYAKHFSLNIQNNTKVVSVQRKKDLFEVSTKSSDGGTDTFFAKNIIAASGSFHTPNNPRILGEEEFKGERLHVLDYRAPLQFSGKRVVIVGAGNSAVQVAFELAPVAKITLAVRDRVKFLPQIIFGKDLHFWLDKTGLDRSRWIKDEKTPVLDTGIYKKAIKSGQIPRRKMFKAFYEEGVQWSDGEKEPIDAVIFATGYLPNLPYLESLGVRCATAKSGFKFGINQKVSGLYSVGFAGQRSLSSATIRGVGRDAAFVVEHILRTQN